MYFFQEQQQRGREGVGGDWGSWGGGREGGKGERPSATGQLSPPNLGVGQLGEGGLRVGGGGPRTSYTFIIRSPLFALAQICKLLYFKFIVYIYLSFFASLKKWRRDQHKLSGASPSRLPAHPPMPPTPSLRHPAPPKEVTPGLCLQRARVRAGKERASDLGRGQVACFYILQ